MDITEAIIKRYSTRAFLDKAVSRKKIQRILTIASHSPSGANTQPWQVAVVSGETKSKLQRQLVQASKDGIPSQISYQYYPITWRPIYKQRRQHCGVQLYQALNIGRDNSAARQTQWQANYRAFDAPVVLLFFIDKTMEAGSFIDYGMFLQSIMLAAMDEGLATCAQASLADYPQIVNSCLGYQDDRLLLCGMALGYEDHSAAVNSYRTPRVPFAEFSQFFD